MPRASLKQRKDGRYKCVYKGVQFMGDTQSEALAKRDAYKRQVDAGLRADASRQTVAQYATRWLKTYKSGIGLRTYNEHVREVNAMIALIGDKAVCDVIPSDIQAVYNLRAGKSASYIRHLAQTVSSIFAAAVADRLLVANPCFTPRPPKGSSGTHRALGEWEMDLIRRSTHRFQPAVMCMLYAGLRRGEALALDIDRDVDFATLTITVREAVHFEGNRPITGNPKTRAGERTVPMPEILADVLRGKNGLVAKSASGTRMSEVAFRRAWNGFLSDLRQILASAKTSFPSADFGAGIAIRTHDLRHTYCTMLYDAGVDLKTAMLWMGHADQAMTLRIYTHLTAKREAEAAKNFRASITAKVQNKVQ